MRVFHWGLVAAVAAARLSADEVQSAHGIAGDTVAALAGVRLVGGLAVRRYARFGRFLRGPGATAACLGDVLHRRERRHLGHTPAGAAMIVALLLRLSGTAVTGWLSAEPDRVALLPGVPGIATAARADDDDGGSYGERREAALEAARRPHAPARRAASGGVAPASVRHRENLVGAMVTGRKRTAAPGDVV